MSKACRDCAFALPEPGGMPLRPGPLQCRRHPPIALVVPTPDGRGAMIRPCVPSVDADFWCGEFKEKNRITVIRNEHLEEHNEVLNS